MKSPARHFPRPFHFIAAGLLGVALYVFVPQLTELQKSFQLLGSVDIFFVSAAIASTVASFFVASATYASLARSPLKYHRTVLVAVANMFTNRLLPAGTGSIATFFMYLRRNRHSATQAGSVIAANNFLGFLAHMTLLLITLTVFNESLAAFKLPSFKLEAIIPIVVVVALATGFISMKKSWHKSLAKNSRQLVRNIINYRQHPWRLLAAYATSLLLTSCYAVTLYFCAQAIGLELSLFAALAVFSIGIAAGTATPTPGGLGGMEAGLLAGLIGFGFAADQALATVILFRIIGYWFTLALGIVTYWYISRRNYLLPRASQ